MFISYEARELPLKSKILISKHLAKQFFIIYPKQLQSSPLDIRYTNLQTVDYHNNRLRPNEYGTLKTG